MINKPKYQWILHHVRATDRVFFGPFENFDEIDLFYQTIPRAEQVNCFAELLINPFECTADEWWFTEIDKLQEKNPELFKRKLEIK